MSPALFTALTNALNRFSVQPLKPHNGSFILQTGEQPLLKINESSMKLADKIELNSKLTPTKATQSQTLVEGSKLGEFFQALTPSIVRLNHLGIGYDCPDISEEIDYYKTQLADTWLHLYEEPSDSPYARWLFVGNRTNWQDPLFELVLTQNNWPPQF